MRTNIVIDDDLMKAALQVSGLKTKRDVVEEALRLLVRRGEQQKIRALRGKLNWEGNLDEIRGGG
ncbi:MAG: type II toxin-antitoxin system VapB family antitoxin [Haliea sp.]|jgi:Arc/MetJ family transcription regulator|nr:type II toxin-antitoxin system VapB family antitoxin [Haliea sp.]